MARYNSAQVVINEIDVSALADVVFGRPYLLMGEAVQGRDDQPTLVQNKANFNKQFGSVNGTYFGPYAANEYLAYGNQLYYKRVTSTKFTRIAAGATATIDTAAATLNITSPGNTISPFLTTTTQVPVALYLKDLVGTRGMIKVYITGWNSGVSKYNITLDSYGIDFSTKSLGSPLTVDLYIGHAEPAFNSEVFFPPADLANSATNQSTVTWNTLSVGEYKVSGLALSADPKYVSSVATGSESYGPNVNADTTVAVTYAAVGGDEDLQVQADTTLVIGYRITFTDGTNESAASEPFFAVATNTGIIVQNVKVQFTALPALPTGYTGYNLYRAKAVVSIAETYTQAELDAAKVSLMDEGVEWFKVPTAVSGAGKAGDPYRYTYAVRTTVPFYEDDINSVSFSDKWLTADFSGDTDKYVYASYETDAVTYDSPVVIGLDGVTAPDHGHYAIFDTTSGTVYGEYVCDKFLASRRTLTAGEAAAGTTTTTARTWVSGTSSALAVGDTLYPVLVVSGFSKTPDVGALLQHATTDTTGQYLSSSYLSASRKLFFYNGTGSFLPTVTSAGAPPAYTEFSVSTDAFYGYKTALGSDYYYFAKSQFDRYAAKAAGRGTWANSYTVYTAYNQATAEFELVIYDANGSLLERWVNSDLDTLVDYVNTYSNYITLTAMSASTSTAFANFIVSTTTSPTQYYSAVLAGGYEGYYAVDETDFIANINSATATAKYNVDPDFTDLVASAQQVENFDNTLNYEVLIIPKWSSYPTLATEIERVVRTRQYSCAVLDLPAGYNPSNAVTYRASSFSGIDSSYVACFWNWGRIYDSINDTRVWLPPTVFVTRAMAVTDQSTTPWAAIAGLRRGLVPSILELEYYPSLAERENLQLVQINPIAKIGNQVAVWGNKTMQKTRSMLSNFNIRRMLVNAELLTYQLSMQMLFEPNDTDARRQLILALQPVFDRISQQRGLLAFGIFDVTTDADVSDNMARFRIELQPTPSMEVISHDFVIKSPTQPITSQDSV